MARDDGRSGIVVLVPFRAPGTGKTRLAAGLDTAERASLAIAMLADVVAAASAVADKVVIAAAGAGAIDTAGRLGLEAIPDPPGPTDLNRALTAATRRLADADVLAVVAADLPCLSPVDLEAVLDEPAAVVVAPTARGGTGVLVRRPPDAIPTAYGPGSAARHLELAADRGLTVAQITTPGVTRDVDTPADLESLGSSSVGVATAELLRTLGQPPRQ